MKEMTDEQKNEACAQVLFDAMLEKRKMIPVQRPKGTMGYRHTDLSGMWIYENPNGEMLGMNYATPEDLYSKELAQSLKPFTTDPAAALLLCDHMKAKGIFSYIENHSGGWEITLRQTEITECGYAEGATFCEAIVNAFLQTLRATLAQEETIALKNAIIEQRTNEANLAIALLKGGDALCQRSQQEESTACNAAAKSSNPTSDAAKYEKGLSEWAYDEIMAALKGMHEQATEQYATIAALRAEVSEKTANLAHADEKIEELQAFIRGNELAGAADIISERDSLREETARLREERDEKQLNIENGQQQLATTELRRSRLFDIAAKLLTRSCRLKEENIALKLEVAEHDIALRERDQALERVGTLRDALKKILSGEIYSLFPSLCEYETDARETWPQRVGFIMTVARAALSTGNEGEA